MAVAFEESSISGPDTQRSWCPRRGSGWTWRTSRSVRSRPAGWNAQQLNKGGDFTAQGLVDGRLFLLRRIW